MIKIHRETGFTLVEMAIVLMILGAALVAGMRLYDSYLKHQQIVTTTSNISLASRAVSDFRARFGRYPCPASLTAARGTAEYGREGDCNPDGLQRDLTTPGDEAPANNVAPGSFANGYYVEQSARMIDSDGDGVDDLRPLVVRGGLPFRDLNLPEDFAYDGYGHRLSYAVTERAAVQSTFNPSQGGISIVDNQATPQSLLNVPDSGLYVVFSHGNNGAGAYSRAGKLVEACPPAGGIESENCQPSAAEAKFVHIPRDSQRDSSHYDDVMAYFSGTDDSLWSVADPDDIVLRKEGRVGVNLKINSPTLPDDSVAVNGVIRAEDKYLTTQLCDQIGGDCWMPELIGGALADGGGMKCPPGFFMTGISGGAPICDDEVEIKCDPGQIMTGLNPDGTIRCSTPPVICNPTNRVICGVTQALPSATNGNRHTLTAGASRRERYRCQPNGLWTTYPEWIRGVCTCDPTQTTTGTTGCGTGFTGTRPYTRTRQCPSGHWSGRVYDNSFDTDCTCTPYKRYRNLACPAGNTNGRIRQVNNYNCVGNRHVPSGWVDTAVQPDPCRCEEKDTVQSNLACPGGLDGTYSRSNHRSCPYFGSWDGWVYDYSGCTCNASKTRTRVVACPNPDEIGSVTEQDTYTCTGAHSGHWDNNWTVLSTDCEVPPPTVCVWNPIGTPVQVVTQPSVPRAGKECTCGSPKAGCFEYGDPNFLKYNMCECK